VQKKFVLGSGVTLMGVIAVLGHKMLCAQRKLTMAITFLLQDVIVNAVFLQVLRGAKAERQIRCIASQKQKAIDKN
jgi:hypothetical protein